MKNKIVYFIILICLVILFVYTSALATQIGNYKVTKADLRYLMSIITNSDEFQIKIKQIVKNTPRSESKKEVKKLAKYYGKILQDALNKFANANNIDLILTEENISQIKSGHKPSKEEMAYFSDKTGKQTLTFLMSTQGNNIFSTSQIENISDQVAHLLDNTNATHITMQSENGDEMFKLNAWADIRSLDAPVGHKDDIWEDIPALKRRVVALLKPEWRNYFETNLKDRMVVGVMKFGDVANVSFSTADDIWLDRFQNIIDENAITRRLEVFVNLKNDKVCIDWENLETTDRFWHCEGKDLLYLGQSKVGDTYSFGKEQYEKYKDK